MPEWCVSPHGIAHLFNACNKDMAISLCGLKKRELAVLKPAPPQAIRCKQCLRFSKNSLD
jgi:hypothetical protein